MNVYELSHFESVDQLVAAATASGDPVVLREGPDECLVAMTPAVFERILFDSDALNRVSRESLRL